MALPTHFRLNTGQDIPSVGFGTFQASPEEVEEAVKVALQAGYRHIDGAAIYRNEAAVGRGVRKSRIPREEIFITSKLWNNRHLPADVEGALDETLRDLGTSYVDLYLMHWPVVFKPGDNQFPLEPSGVFALDDIPLADTWAAMERLLATGKTKAIGVSNFNIRRLEELMKVGEVVPAVNQIEAHPYMQQPKLLEFCKCKGIMVQAYSPLGNNEAGLPRTIDDPAVQQLANEAGMDAGALLVSWAVQRGTIVLPKSVTAHRIRSNMVLQKLPEHIFQGLNKLERHQRYNYPSRWGWNVFDELDEKEVKRLAHEHAEDNKQKWGGFIDV